MIIPAYNEEGIIVDVIRAVQKNAGEELCEIIVVDGGSADHTVVDAEKAGARVTTSSQKGRAAQMNYGAKQAEGEILYFLHADSIPPADFGRKVVRAVDREFESGCFQLAFDTDHFLLSFYAWCTRFDIDAFRFGDQSLFINKNIFLEIGGFREDHLVMEDNEMVRRIKKGYSFTLLDDTVETSARAYREVGVIKLQLIFVVIYLLYFLGVKQETLADLKRKTIG